MRTSPGALLLGLAAAACASGAPSDGDEPAPPPYGAAWADVPGVLRVADVPFPEPLREFVLTTYPTARRAEYGDLLLPLDDALWIDESSDDVDAHLRAAGLEIGWRELPPEGYVLATSHEAGRTVVLTAARDAAGRAWAEQALAQVTHLTDGPGFVRACRILDAPVFPLRGSKRPQAWETRYRANFGWEVRDGWDFTGRETAVSYSPGHPFDATPERAEDVLDAWRAAHARGTRRFCVEFDDVEFGLTPAARELHGEYAPALRAFLVRLREGLREIDPDAVLYYLPQTYWWADPELPPFTEALRAAGGLPLDVGLVMTGPEIISETIDEIGLAAARLQFGLVQTPALVYDNLGREGDWGPLTGRDPRLRTQCEAVFGERGTPVNRLTRLDWHWNPHDYDPERSWRRAVLEVAGPAAYEALAAVCSAFRRGAPREEAAELVRRFAEVPGPETGALPRREVVSLLRDDLRRLRPRDGSRDPPGPRTSP